MIMMPFALACIDPPVAPKVIKAWRLENVYAVDFYRNSFTEEQILQHTQTSEWLAEAVESQVCMSANICL